MRLYIVITYKEKYGAHIYLFSIKIQFQTMVSNREVYSKFIFWKPRRRRLLVETVDYNWYMDLYVHNEIMRSQKEEAQLWKKLLKN